MKHIALPHQSWVQHESRWDKYNVKHLVASFKGVDRVSMIMRPNAGMETVYMDYTSVRDPFFEHDEEEVELRTCRFYMGK